MINNDRELQGTQERISYFQGVLAQMRKAAPPDLFPNMASGYSTEIEKMQKEVMEYLTHHVTQSPQAEVA
jgi:hypothetical protein